MEYLSTHVHIHSRFQASYGSAPPGIHIWSGFG